MCKFAPRVANETKEKDFEIRMLLLENKRLLNNEIAITKELDKVKCSLHLFRQRYNMLEEAASRAQRDLYREEHTLSVAERLRQDIDAYLQQCKIPEK